MRDLLIRILEAIMDLLPDEETPADDSREIPSDEIRVPVEPGTEIKDKEG